MTGAHLLTGRKHDYFQQYAQTDRQIWVEICSMTATKRIAVCFTSGALSQKGYLELLQYGLGLASAVTYIIGYDREYEKRWKRK